MGLTIRRSRGARVCVLPHTIRLFHKSKKQTREYMCENYSMCSYARYYVCRASDYEIAWKWSCLATSLAQRGILQACLFYHCRHVSFHQFQIVVIVQKATIGLNLVQARIIKSSALQKPLAENAQTHCGIEPYSGSLTFKAAHLVAHFSGRLRLPLTSWAADYPCFQLRTS